MCPFYMKVRKVLILTLFLLFILGRRVSYSYEDIYSSIFDGWGFKVDRLKPNLQNKTSEFVINKKEDQLIPRFMFPKKSSYSSVLLVKSSELTGLSLEDPKLLHKVVIVVCNEELQFGSVRCGPNFLEYEKDGSVYIPMIGRGGLGKFTKVAILNSGERIRIFVPDIYLIVPLYKRSINDYFESLARSISSNSLTESEDKISNPKSNNDLNRFVRYLFYTIFALIILISLTALIRQVFEDTGEPKDLFTLYKTTLDKLELIGRWRIFLLLLFLGLVTLYFSIFFILPKFGLDVTRLSQNTVLFLLSIGGFLLLCIIFSDMRNIKGIEFFFTKSVKKKLRLLVKKILVPSLVFLLIYLGIIGTFKISVITFSLIVVSLCFLLLNEKDSVSFVSLYSKREISYVFVIFFLVVALSFFIRTRLLQTYKSDLFDLDLSYIVLPYEKTKQTLERFNAYFVDNKFPIFVDDILVSHRNFRKLRYRSLSEFRDTTSFIVNARNKQNIIEEIIKNDSFGNFFIQKEGYTNIFRIKNYKTNDNLSFHFKINCLTEIKPSLIKLREYPINISKDISLFDFPGCYKESVEYDIPLFSKLSNPGEDVFEIYGIDFKYISGFQILSDGDLKVGFYNLSKLDNSPLYYERVGLDQDVIVYTDREKLTGLVFENSYEGKVDLGSVLNILADRGLIGDKFVIRSNQPFLELKVISDAK